MVGKIFNLLHQEIRGLHEAAYFLGFFALLSAVLALVRDRLLAHFLGAGEILDIYYASFRIPDLVFVSIASMVSIYVLIPFLTKNGDSEKDKIEKQKVFIGGILPAFFLFISTVSAILFILVPYILPFIFPGLKASIYFGDLIILTRLLLLQPILLGLSNIFASITQVYGRFILYAFAPLLYNLGIIIGMLFFYPKVGILGLGYGVLLGALLHVGIQIPFIAREGFLSRLSIYIRITQLKQIIFLSLPRTLALSVNHLATLVLIGVASVMAKGSIAIFNLSFNLQAVPLAIIGASYSVAAFPTLARLFSIGERKDFFEHIVIATRHIIFWSTPIVVLFVVLRAQIVRVILGSGAFDWSDTRLTAAALALFSVSLIAQGLTLLFIRGYYAAGNTLKPLLVNIFSAGLMVVLSYSFVQLFFLFPLWQYFTESLLRVEGIPGTEILMLPLGYSIAALVNAGIFLFLIHRDFRVFSRSVSRPFFEILSASIVMGFVVHQFLNVFDSVFDINTFWGIFAQGFLSGILGIAVGIILLKLLKNKEIDEIQESLRKKFWRVKTVGSEEIEL